MRVVRVARLFMLLLLTSAAVSFAEDDTKQGYHPAPSEHLASSRDVRIVGVPDGAQIPVIAIDGTVELGLAAVVHRGVEAYADAPAIILDINTFGGRVDAATQIRDALLGAKPPVVAFIHPRAISAGALIALACDTIFISSGGTIGAATPIQMGGGGQAEPVEEKMVSYMRAEMRTTAEANGRRGDIAEAMVDAEVVIDGVVEAGKLLTLDTHGAIEYGIADAKADNLQEVLAAIGAEKAYTVELALNWGERIARIVTEPTLSGMLLSIGMLGLMVAFYTRSVGPFTMVGFICLALFFGGHAVVHLVGWEEALLLLGGLTLILIEITVVPGFGLPGVLGGICLLAALVMSFTALPLDVSFEIGTLGDAINRVMLSMLGTVVMGAIFLRYMPRTALGRRLVLDSAIAEHATSNVSVPESLVGSLGEAITALSPSGKVRIGDKRYDARSERERLNAGDAVRVIRVQHGELLVRPLAGAADDEGES